MTKDLKGIDDYTLSKIIGSSNIKRGPFFKDIISVKIGGQTFNSTDIIIKPTNVRFDYYKYLSSYCNEPFYNEITTHKDFWNFRIELYINGFLSIDEKPQSLKPKSIEIINFHKDSSINDLINKTPQNLRSKLLKVIESNNLDDILEYLNCESDITNITIYEREIYQHDTLLNQLFNIKDEGTGKGEVLCSFLYKDFEVQGSSSSYDLYDKNNFMRVEVKAPNSKGFRSGTKGSVSRYNFYKNISESINVLKKLMNQITLIEFKHSYSNDFYLASCAICSDEKFKNGRSIIQALADGELTFEMINYIKFWFYLAHVETFKYKGQDIIKEDVFRHTYETYNNSKLIHVLRSLTYVNDPHKLFEDINEEIKSFFNNIEYLIIFNENKKNISIHESSANISFDCISQNGIKIIETKYDTHKKCFLNDALNIWKNDKSKNFYSIFTSLNPQ